MKMFNHTKKQKKLKTYDWIENKYFFTSKIYLFYVKYDIIKLFDKLSMIQLLLSII